MISKEKIFGILIDYEEVLVKKLLQYGIEEEEIFEKIHEFKAKIVTVKIRSDVLKELEKDEEVESLIFSLDSDIYSFFEEYMEKNVLFTSSLLETICKLCVSFIDLATEYEVKIQNIRVGSVLQYYAHIDYDSFLQNNEVIKVQKLLIIGIKSLPTKDRVYINDCIYELLSEEFYLGNKKKKASAKNRNFNIAYLESFRKNLIELKELVV
ncbi:MAG: hypothetical protein Q4D02_02130 [Clostridia bacterium]|nr:hypothetical protein [Clostridia bacterium]